MIKVKYTFWFGSFRPAKIIRHICIETIGNGNQATRAFSVLMFSGPVVVNRNFLRREGGGGDEGAMSIFLA